MTNWGIFFEYVPNEWQITENPELNKIYIHRNGSYQANQPIDITISYEDKTSINESAIDKLNLIMEELDDKVSFTEPPKELFNNHWQDSEAVRMQQIDSIVLPDRTVWQPIDDLVVINADDGFLIVQINRSGFENYYLDNEVTDIVNSIRLIE